MVTGPQSGCKESSVGMLKVVPDFLALFIHLCMHKSAPLGFILFVAFWEIWEYRWGSHGWGGGLKSSLFDLNHFLFVYFLFIYLFISWLLLSRRNFLCKCSESAFGFAQ